MTDRVLAVVGAVTGAIALAIALDLWLDQRWVQQFQAREQMTIRPPSKYRPRYPAAAVGVDDWMAG